MMSCLRLSYPTKYVQLECNTEHSYSLRIVKFIQPEYTLDLSNVFDEYTTPLVRSKLARNIAALFKDVREELVMAMDDLVPIHEDSTWQSYKQRGYSSHSPAEWIKVPIRETMQRVICRTTNRIFVGAPLCP